MALPPDQLGDVGEAGLFAGQVEGDAVAALQRQHVAFGALGDGLEVEGDGGAFPGAAAGAGDRIIGIGTIGKAHAAVFELPAARQDDAVTWIPKIGAAFGRDIFDLGAVAGIKAQIGIAGDILCLSHGRDDDQQAERKQKCAHVLAPLDGYSIHRPMVLAHKTSVV